MLRSLVHWLECDHATTAAPTASEHKQLHSGGVQASVSCPRKVCHRLMNVEPEERANTTLESPRTDRIATALFKCNRKHGRDPPCAKLLYHAIEAADDRRKRRRTR